MKLGPRNTFNISTCCSQLIKLALAIKSKNDFVIIEGHVGRMECEKRGDVYMTSPHHSIPSRAFKIIPMPFDGVLSKESIDPIINSICEKAKELDIKLKLSIVSSSLQVELIDP